MVDRVGDTIDIEAVVDDIFAAATDFESYPDWNANVKGVEVKETDGEGRGTRVWWQVDARIRTVSYTLSYDYSEAPQRFSWELLDGDIKQLNGSYSFDEFDDVTEVAYELAIDPGFPVPGFIKRQAERQIVRSALEDLKKRVEHA